MLCCDVCSKKGIFNVEGEARNRETPIGNMDLCAHHYQEFTDLLKMIADIFLLKTQFTEEDSKKIINKLLPTFPGYDN